MRDHSLIMYSQLPITDQKQVIPEGLKLTDTKIPMTLSWNYSRSGDPKQRKYDYQQCANEFLSV